SAFEVFPRLRGEQILQGFTFILSNGLSLLARGTLICRPTARRYPQFFAAGAWNILIVCLSL
ncbi:hypothetical protein, partial [Salmonella enterica]|uniref:hypothetical protein n=1 Tax=Salmonella enterica TaxID=28901 RepID=UPI001C994C96